MGEKLKINKIIKYIELFNLEIFRFMDQVHCI